MAVIRLVGLATCSQLVTLSLCGFFITAYQDGGHQFIGYSVGLVTYIAMVTGNYHRPSYLVAMVTWTVLIAAWLTDHQRLVETTIDSWSTDTRLTIIAALLTMYYLARPKRS